MTKYQIEIHPDGKVEKIPSECEMMIDEVGTIRHRKIDHNIMDLPGGVLVYDEASEEPINMAATKLVKMPSHAAVRGRALVGMITEDGAPKITLDDTTADWAMLWAGDRCTVCGESKSAVIYPAFPISAGKCCEKCNTILKSVRSYMGIGNWTPRAKK